MQASDCKQPGKRTANTKWGNQFCNDRFRFNQRERNNMSIVSYYCEISNKNRHYVKKQEKFVLLDENNWKMFWRLRNLSYLCTRFASENGA